VSTGSLATTDPASEVQIPDEVSDDTATPADQFGGGMAADETASEE
jgi:hypothetical protein